MSVSKNDVLENCGKWNYGWLKENFDHWLHLNWKVLHGKSVLYAETSCDVTATTIRQKILGSDKSLSIVIEDSPLFDSIANLNSFFQVSIGEDWDNSEHILTVWDNTIFQSYYNKYKIKISDLTSEIINAFDNISENGNYEKITGVEFNNSQNLKVFYWVPSS